MRPGQADAAEDALEDDDDGLADDEPVTRDSADAEPLTAVLLDDPWEAEALTGAEVARAMLVTEVVDDDDAAPPPPALHCPSWQTPWSAGQSRSAWQRTAGPTHPLAPMPITTELNTSHRMRARTHRTDRAERRMSQLACSVPAVSSTTARSSGSGNDVSKSSMTTELPVS